MSYVVPIFILFVFIYSAFKKINCFKTFTAGAGKAIDLTFTVFPTLVAIFVLLSIMSLSGLDVLLANTISPFFELIGIDKNLSMLIILRPFSGSASLAMVENIFATYGVDSYLGITASVIMASSDTLLYITAIYLSKTKTKKLAWTLPVGFLVAILSSVIACFVCRFF